MDNAGKAEKKKIVKDDWVKRRLGERKFVMKNKIRLGINKKKDLKLTYQ